MQLSKSIITKSKLSILALAAFGLLAIPMAGSADAKPYRPGYAHASLKVNAEFRALDKNKNGVLSRADFQVVTTRWVKRGRTWRKVRTVTIAPRFAILLRTTDLNRNGVITLAEYRRVELAKYTPPRPHIVPKPLPRKPAPLPARRVIVRDHR